MTPRQLMELGDRLFTKKFPLTALHQEVADNFYPERADFTLTRSPGTDFAAQLMTSFPILCRRDLADQFSTMLRPTARPWFHFGLKHDSDKTFDLDTKKWLEWFEKVQRRAMYDQDAQFTRATKLADNDYAAFGNCIISVEMNYKKMALLYRCWHVRDLAWAENEDGQIGTVFRKWKPTAQQLMRTFKDKNDERVSKMADKEPFEEVECYHMVVDGDMYDEKGLGTRKRWSIYYDRMHDHVIEATPIHGRFYVIPRWQAGAATVVGAVQYGYSPAVVAALPDARLLQAITYTLMEATEKAAAPPYLAVENVIKSDLSLYANGVTWIDGEYDERTGEALRPMEQDFRGMMHGIQMGVDTRTMIHKSFYLDALTLPQRTPEMTAYEVGQRVQEYIRAALPLFEPMEQDYNGQLCDESYEVLWRHGAMGDPRLWPKKIRPGYGGPGLDFNFESPLHDLIDQQKGDLFQRGGALIAGALSLDPSASAVPKADIALREALSGIGWPAGWMRTETEQAAQVKKVQQAQEATAKLQAMQSASETAKNIGQSGLVPTGGGPGGGMPAAGGGPPSPSLGQP